MPDTLEKRVEDLEQILAHLPEDLDARFAGVDVKLAELREVLALHTTRFSKLEARFNDLDRKVDGLDRKVDGLDRKVDGLSKIDGLNTRSTAWNTRSTVSRGKSRVISARAKSAFWLRSRRAGPERWPDRWRLVRHIWTVWLWKFANCPHRCGLKHARNRLAGPPVAPAHLSRRLPLSNEHLWQKPRFSNRRGPSSP